MALLLCVALLPAAASAAEYSGDCGEGLTWSFADGRLTISGSGDMTDYNQLNLPPWHAFREQIYYLSLPEGLTTIGDMAFYDCVNLTAATMPSTVTEIGRLAFCQCRNLAILCLNSGLLRIGRSAFEQCEALQDLRLPDTVTTLGYHAFYACMGLTYVKIPASVTQMDAGVFAYCEYLVHAELAAPLAVVPSWTFYGCNRLTSIALHQQITGSEVDAFTGCENLRTVYYAGPEENAQQLMEQIGADEENFQSVGTITNETPESSGGYTELEEDEDGNVTANDVNVTQTEDSTISVSTTVTAEETEMSIDATIVTEEGWQELLDVIDEAKGRADGTVDISVYVTTDTGVPPEVLNAVSGSSIDMTVHGQDGSRFSVDGASLNTTQDAAPVSFSYSANRMETPDFPELADNIAYRLAFSSSSAVRVEVLIRLPQEYARRTASLYRAEGEALVLLQSVLVDLSGYAHFYLASVDATESYRIGIDIPGVDSGSVIVPQDYYDEYGINYNYPDFSQYVVTGRTSSLGVSLGGITGIMIGVMIASVVCVGVVLFLLNKRKLKKGYVPDISEEDLEE